MTARHITRIVGGALLLLILLSAVPPHAFGNPGSPGGAEQQPGPTISGAPNATTSVLRPRWAPKKDKVVIDPEHAVAGVFVVKFAEGSHVRPGPNGLTIDDKAVRSNSEEVRRLARTGLTLTDAQTELNAVSTTLLDAHATLGFELTPAFRPPGFVYDVNSVDADQPFRETAELEQRSGEELADLDLYYVAHAKDFTDREAQQELMNRLNAYRIVEQVYVTVPADVPQAGPTPDLSAGQGYLGAAPAGLNGLYARTRPGGRGDGVRLIDVEFDWVTDHEDFPAAANRFWGGRPACAYDGTGSEHGTAVLGVIASPGNGFGVTGFAPNVQYGLSSVCRPFDYAWAAAVATFSGEHWVGRAHNVVVANAIRAAADQLRPGDVLLVEQHVPGPTTGRTCPATGNCGQWDYVPMEFYQESFDVIRRITASGIVVVEAAGNGTTNLDAPLYSSRFDPAVRHSGALLVGASGAGNNMPNGSSNSTARIDVHAWGTGVVTLGYGIDGTPPFDSARPVNRRYRASFSGTSSASAIVSGAVASLQGARIAAGRPALSPVELTNLLRATGSPQLGTPEAIAARPIGRQPNLCAAIDIATASGGGFTGPGRYTIRSKSSGKVFDINIDLFRGQDNGQPLVQHGFHGGLNQQFEVVAMGDGSYELMPRHAPGKTLDVAGASAADRAGLQQFAASGAANQRFRIEPVGGVYRIVNVNSGKVIEVPGFSRDDGVQLRQAVWTGGDNQLWEFAPIR